MQKNKRHYSMLARQFKTIVPVLTLLGTATSAWSEQLPDAGRLLREQPKAPALTPGAPQSVIPAAPSEQPLKDFGPKFLVKGFKIDGATLIPEPELQAQIKDSVGKELNFKQLFSITTLLTGYYSEKGYVARVILPPQDIEDGIVHIKIIEGQRGNVQIENKGVRLDPSRVQAFIDARLARGDKFDLNSLGETLAILNEQPGIRVSSRMDTGGEESNVDLVVTAEDKPLTNVQLAINNHGSRGTGEPQAFGSITFNNLFGWFDAASMMLNASEGTRYLRGEYAIAVGNRGMRASVNASGLDYDITQDSLRALDAHGHAITGGVGLSYPLIRRSDLSLSLSGSYDHKILRDYTAAGRTGDRNIEAFGISLSGYRYDQFMNGGQTSFGLTLGAGDVSLDDAAAKATDRASRDTDGSYAKLGYQISRYQTLPGQWSLSASLSGQFAADNLDSTERLGLGGPNAVRAYPAGEANGDEGWLASVNLTYNFNETLSATAFVDGGRIRLNKNTWANWNAGNPRLDNTYGLSGGGFAVNWLVARAFALNATIATPFGDNPGRDANGEDSDGRSRDVRGWISLATEF